MSGEIMTQGRTAPVPSSAVSPASSVSIVIVSYETGPCLWPSLRAAMAEPEVGEVVVVDNGNPAAVTEELQLLSQTNPRLRVLTGHGNIGFAAGCNLGAAQSQGEFLLFANPDLVLSRGAVRRLLRSVPAHIGHGPLLVGGRLLGPDGREQRGARRDHITPWSAFVTFSGLSRLGSLHPAFRDPHWERDPLPVGPQRVGAVSGAMLLVSRRDFGALGGFDQGYFLHVEDLDLCRRAWEAGGEVIFAPDAEGIHIGCTSKTTKVFVERCKAAGFARYFRRFARGPGEQALVAALVPMLSLAFLLRGALKDLPSRLHYANSPRVGVRSRRAPA